MVIFPYRFLITEIFTNTVKNEENLFNVANRCLDNT